MKNTLLIILLFVCPLFAQTEVLTNVEIIEMAKAGLSKEVIIEKMKASTGEYDSSAKSLIELKKAGVEDAIIKFILEKSKAIKEKSINDSLQSQALQERERFTPTKKVFSPSDALQNAKTIAILKDSINPTRQALEKELLKRPEWKSLDLVITENKESADLYIEISYVHFSILTHRYVFRVYDTQSGTVICAGETTSWGSLAENLARNIVKEMVKVPK